jgi:hypothetical protein
MGDGQIGFFTNEYYRKVERPFRRPLQCLRRRDHRFTFHH